MKINFTFDIDTWVYDEFGIEAVVKEAMYDGFIKRYKISTPFIERVVTEGELLDAYVQFSMRKRKV